MKKGTVMIQREEKQRIVMERTESSRCRKRENRELSWFRHRLEKQSIDIARRDGGAYGELSRYRQESAQGISLATREPFLMVRAQGK